MAAGAVTGRVPVVVWGASGHALVVRDALDPETHEICALMDRADIDAPFAAPLFTGPHAFEEWRATVETVDGVHFVLAVGGARGADRLALHQRLVSEGLSPLTVVHDRAFVASDSRCGEGAQVLALAALCAGANLGRQSILNTAATVDHECDIGDGVHVGPGAHLAGLVTVGDEATIGTGAVVLPRLTLGRGATVGAGAVVTRSVPDGVTVVGNPAREVSR